MSVDTTSIQINVCTTKNDERSQFWKESKKERKLTYELNRKKQMQQWRNRKKLKESSSKSEQVESKNDSFIKKKSLGESRKPGNISRKVDKISKKPEKTTADGGSEFARFLTKEEVASERKKIGTASKEQSSPEKKKKEPEANVSDGEVSKPAKPYKPTTRASDSPGTGVSGGRITSLFGNNPDIPIVARRAVRPVHEEVFSDKKISDLPIHPHLVSTLAALGLTQLTTVQQKAAPVLLDGQDALVRSQTGSGKTLAYALPLVEMLRRVEPPLTRADGVQAVVVLPTRELALQTYEWFLKLFKPFMRLVPGCLVGGEKRKSEKARLRKGITVLVGTPGRIIDHVQHTRSLRLDRVRWLVLDEADRLLDMGYEKDVASLVSTLDSQNAPMLPPEAFSWNRGEGKGLKSKEEVKNQKIRFQSNSESEDNDEDEGKEQEESDDEDEENVVKAEEEEEVGVAEKRRVVTRHQRQTVLLSATLTPAVERLAGLALRSPVFLDAADVDADAPDVVIPDSLVQYYLIAPPKLRLVTLAAFVVWKCKFTEQRKMLLFCATQDMVDYLTELLTAVLTKDDDDEDSDDDEDENRFTVDIDFFRLHGNMDQKERTQVFQTFREAECGVLLCTDVAARGLDLPHVDWIVQYTAPTSVSDYVHRVGRTARVGAAGSALLFLTPSEVEFVQMLQDRRISLQEEKVDRCLHKLASISGSLSVRQKPEVSVETAASALQLRFESAVLQRRDLHDVACKAYMSYVRFYASYPRDMREVFNYKAQHLGHHAKSFALRDAPKTIAGIGRSRYQRQLLEGSDGKPKRIKQHDGHRTSKPLGISFKDKKRDRELMISEFASGLEPVKKKRKTLG